jgi:predicted SnoaL-like aldol condensation-catalyzing enzyme
MRTEEGEANLRLVKRVYEEVLSPCDSSRVEQLFAPGYIQHNPNAATGSQGLKQMLDGAKAKYGNVEHRVKRMMVDGNLVAAHVHVIFSPGDEGLAAVDIFRIEDGRIAEHWDVAQPVAKVSSNSNGMF